MTFTILGCLGWLLFVLIALLYFAGNKLNAEENNALAVQIMAVALSDTLRETYKANIERGLLKVSPDAKNSAIVYTFMTSITASAKESWRSSEYNSLALVIELVAQLRQQQNNQ